MKKTASLQISNRTVAIGKVITSIAIIRNKTAKKAARLLSEYLETEITPQQAICIIRSMIAFSAMVLPFYMHIVIRLTLIIIFGITLLQCRQAGIHD
jgi:hypothetical protein